MQWTCVYSEHRQDQGWGAEGQNDAAAAHLNNLVAGSVEQDGQQVAACLRSGGSLEVSHQLRSASKLCDRFWVELQASTALLTALMLVFCKSW